MHDGSDNQHTTAPRGQAGGALPRPSHARTASDPGVSLPDTGADGVGAPFVRPRALWSEAIRAVLCLLPMLLADLFGKGSYIGPLGQAGFFVSAMFLPRTIDARLNLFLIVSTLGGGLYLLGGNVVDTPWLALVFIVMVGVMVSFMTAWEYGSMLALGLTVIFCAGLNSGSVERAASNFRLYVFGVLWGGAVTLLPIWRSVPERPRPRLGQVEYAEQGTRLGLGAAAALGVAYLFGFAKLGWAPSAVGNVVRYEHEVSRSKAIGRAIGTLIGGAIALGIMLAFDKTRVFVLFAVGFTALNAVFKATEVSGLPLVSVPFLQTVAILLMLSADRPHLGAGLTAARVGTNELGIVIGLLIVFYPLPLIMKLVRRIHASGPQLPERTEGDHEPSEELAEMAAPRK
jgi:hypothetical protein